MGSACGGVRTPLDLQRGYLSRQPTPAIVKANTSIALTAQLLGFSFQNSHSHELTQAILNSSHRLSTTSHTHKSGYRWTRKTKIWPLVAIASRDTPRRRTCVRLLDEVPKVPEPLTTPSSVVLKAVAHARPACRVSWLVSRPIVE